VPSNASGLPATYRGANGGWAAVYSGVPGIIVNSTFLSDHGIPVPRTWNDLLNPVYKGLIGIGKVGPNATATAIFVAWNLAAGGTLDDYAPGIAYARQILPNLTTQATPETFEKGEVPISLRFDFSHIALAAAEAEKGIPTEIIIPPKSVYMPYALAMNRFDTAHRDFGAMFMEWALSDEGQTIYARFGARPIRSVAGSPLLVVSDAAKANWLPDDAYAEVLQVDFAKVDPEAIGEMWENEVLLGP
jgi:putative spermidine/putrescine transport system substrate-binding protein